MILSIAEVLDKADKQPTRERKIQALRENYTSALKDILVGAYDDRVEWALPHGPVPFKPGPDRESEGMLIAQTRTLYLYTKGGGAPKGLSQMRRETLFVQLLESLHPDDAKIVIAMKDKKLPYNSITRELVNAAFPKMIYSTPRAEKRDEWEEGPVIEEPPAAAVVDPAVAALVDQPRKVGRPRKYPAPDPNAPKRPRGRPRKDPLRAH